jgi:hypothetical protein
MIQVAAQLLIYANPLSISSTVWASEWIQHGNRAGHAQRPLLSTGRTGFQTSLIQ